MKTMNSWKPMKSMRPVKLMKRWALYITAILSLSFLMSSTITGCGIISRVFPEEDTSIVIHEKSLDTTVEPSKAKSLGEYLFASVPQLADFRHKLEADTGKKIKLSISVQSSPDANGLNDIEKNYYYMYVPYTSKDGLLRTFTFLIHKDSNEILVFAENGDDTISVDRWAEEVVKSKATSS